jgi:DNA-binding NarL/FixJ family response regulator
MYQLRVIEMNSITAKPVLVCDTQPVVMEGVRWLLDNSSDLRFAGAVSNLEAAFELTRALSPAAIILDKGLGAPAVMDWLHKLGASGLTAAPMLWGMGITESEALRFLQAGARGIIRRTAEPETLMTCVRSVANGVTWMEEGIFGTNDKPARPRRSSLTSREQEITELVERGLRNRDIAKQLGIQTGTVKIHLKHIFEKTGVKGRYGLALTGLREKGTIPTAWPAMPECLLAQ